MHRLFPLLALAVLTAALVKINEGQAADIRASRSSSCVIEIAGELREGDYDRFAAVAGDMFPNDDAESTSSHTVCLDSPGGNLAEGVKFARHFYKIGVGTVIDADKECHSACAIMFMMGTAQGGEVAFVNRKLHARGTLGFHRPYLNVRSGGSIDVAALALAYDNAFQSALDLIAMANGKAPWTNTPMMKSDLVEAMLSHIGNDMFLVDTVDRVARFDIELFGFASPSSFGEAEAFYACQNSLQWQKGLTTDSITYVRKVSEPTPGYRRVKEIDRNGNGPVYEVEGLASGYAREGCVVYQEGDAIKACGLDEYTTTSLGGGECGRTDYQQKGTSLLPLAVLDPATPIASLRLVSRKTATAMQPSAIDHRVPGGSTCFVRAGDQILDEEPCTQVLGRTSGGHEVVNFIWPSGGKTVLVMRPNGPEINGVATRAIDRQAFGQCYLNSQTGREFCISSHR